jgi:hypothetical protein
MLNPSSAGITEYNKKTILRPTAIDTPTIGIIF